MLACVTQIIKEDQFRLQNPKIRLKQLRAYLFMNLIQQKRKKIFKQHDIQ